MSRAKKRPKFNHQASTHEYISCLRSMIKWSEVLLQQNNGKPYNEFLEWIIEKQYFKNIEGIPIKKIAVLSNYSNVKISKWLREIYNDILELNQKNPILFYVEKGFNVELHFEHYDDYCIFNFTLPTVPRIYDRIGFYFIKAAMGTNYFWVKDIMYYIEENEVQIIISLHGNILNKYRELMLDKALFNNEINLHDKFHFEIDNELKRLNK